MRSAASMLVCFDCNGAVMLCPHDLPSVPSVDDLAGIAPDWTGDLTTEEYLDRQRDWREQPLDAAMWQVPSER